MLIEKQLYRFNGTITHFCCQVFYITDILRQQVEEQRIISFFPALYDEQARNGNIFFGYSADDPTDSTWGSRYNQTQKATGPADAQQIYESVQQVPVRDNSDDLIIFINDRKSADPCSFKEQQGDMR